MLVSCGHRSGRMLLAFLEPAGKAAGGHHRLDGQRPGGADHPQAVRHVRLVATLDGHDLGVNRGRVHGASVDQADGALVEAGLDHPGEEPGSAPMRTRPYRVTVCCTERAASCSWEQ
jgi:hypothetical protein